MDKVELQQIEAKVIALRDDVDATIEALQAQVAAKDAENRRLRAALVLLEIAATAVHSKGAQSGSQWFKLTSALLKARSALGQGEG